MALLLSAAAAAAALGTGLYLTRPLPAGAMDFSPAAVSTLPPEARLDLNAATAGELEGLPGVGPVTAEAIIARRTELGAFRCKEDVLSVPGIGEAAYARIEPYITY